tara:strand:- start:218 stop:712 length:495 start_codon:yes stop_codon:yes gene_type:complete
MRLLSVAMALSGVRFFDVGKQDVRPRRLTSTGDFHMNKITKATIIWRRLLELDRFDWHWGNDARDAVVTEGEGWSARVWLSEKDREHRADCDTVDVLLYYMWRQALSCSVELTVDDEVVFSMHLRHGQPEILVLRSGEWESEIFNLPKRQTKAAAVKEARQYVH